MKTSDCQVKLDPASNSYRRKLCWSNWEENAKQTAWLARKLVSTVNTFICVSQMVFWQHPSNETAVVFHDNLPSSDTLTDLVEDTTRTAWWFSTMSSRKHTEGQHTASKTQYSQCVQTEIHAFSTAKISLLRKIFLWQAGKWNETDFFSSRFLTFSAFPHPTCSCNIMLYFACKNF